MDNLLRLFIAIEVPSKVLSVLTQLIQGLTRSRIDGLKPVRPEGIHLTLRFLGNVDRERVPDIVDALTEATTVVTSFALRLGRPGIFPRRGPPRVLWVGLDDQVEALAKLRCGVQNALSTIGLQGEQWPFHPHLTVARFRGSTRTTDQLAVCKAFLKYDIPLGRRIDVQHISLTQSTLRPRGTLYSRLAEIPLSTAWS